MQEDYIWIKNIIESCTTQWHLEVCSNLLHLFQRKHCYCDCYAKLHDLLIAKDATILIAV